MPDIPVPDIPALVHGFALVVGSNAIGLSPPGDSSVAPSGTPTGPTDDVAPGMPRGVLVPIAGAIGIAGAICAKPAPALSRSSSDAITRLFNLISLWPVPK